MGVGLWVWVATVAAILVLIALDFVAISRNPREVGMREAAAWSAVYRVLLFGVTAALVMRAVFIAVGAAAIQRFSVTFLLFGGLLIWTAVQLFRHRDEGPEVDDNALLRGPGGGCRPPTATPAPG